MEEELFRKIIDECGRHPELERVLLYLMNEPLTDKNIVERINYAKENNPQSCAHILTNGSLLTEELSRRIIGSRLDWIGFSVHGIRKNTYESSMRGVPFERTISNICRFIELARDKRSDEFVMITFFRYNNLSPEEKEEAMGFWKAQGVKRISYFDGPVSRAGNVAGIPHPEHTLMRGCRSIWRDDMIHILYNGRVVLCCMDWRRNTLLGNVNCESISEIWNGPRYDYAKAVISGELESPKDFICMKCEEAVQ